MVKSQELALYDQEQGCPLLPLLFNTVSEVINQTIRQEERNESHPNGEEEVKCHYLQMIWFYMLRIPKTPSKILLEIISVEKFQIKNQYTKKSVVFLYANNELAGRGIKETIPLIVATKKIETPRE